MARMAVISLAVLGLSHFASCSGTFYQKVSDSSDDADISTKVFHECSFKNNCKYLGIPVDNAGDKATTAATMQELQVTGEKQQIWKKIDLEDSKEDSSDVKAFKSCKDAYQAGIKKSGKLKLLFANSTTIDVYCDMTTSGGGWLVFQRRINSSVSFYRDWKAYENGFDDLNSNFWLGLQKLSYFTSNGNWTLRVDLKTSFEGSTVEGYAEYTSFVIGRAQQKYKLMFGQYSGNIGDALEISNGMAFTTYDQDNDLVPNDNCASFHKGAWWHEKCFRANLNNLYPGSSFKHEEMMSWYEWKNAYGNIIFSEMKIKFKV